MKPENIRKLLTFIDAKHNKQVWQIGVDLENLVRQIVKDEKNGAKSDIGWAILNSIDK